MIIRTLVLQLFLLFFVTVHCNNIGANNVKVSESYRKHHLPLKNMLKRRNNPTEPFQEINGVDRSRLTAQDKLTEQAPKLSLSTPTYAVVYLSRRLKHLVLRNPHAADYKKREIKSRELPQNDETGGGNITDLGQNLKQLNIKTINKKTDDLEETLSKESDGNDPEAMRISGDLSKGDNVYKMAEPLAKFDQESGGKVAWDVKENVDSLQGIEISNRQIPNPKVVYVNVAAKEDVSIVQKFLKASCIVVFTLMMILFAMLILFIFCIKRKYSSSIFPYVFLGGTVPNSSTDSFKDTKLKNGQTKSIMKKNGSTVGDESDKLKAKSNENRTHSLKKSHTFTNLLEDAGNKSKTKYERSKSQLSNPKSSSSERRSSSTVSWKSTNSTSSSDEFADIPLNSPKSKSSSMGQAFRLAAKKFFLKNKKCPVCSSNTDESTVS